MKLKRQVWFQTNLYYYSTRSRLRRSEIIGGLDDWRGRLTFYLKDFPGVAVQITTKAKLGITYPEELSYEKILERLKPLLVQVDGTPAEIVSVIKEPVWSKEDVRRELEHFKRMERIRELEVMGIHLAVLKDVFGEEEALSMPYFVDGKTLDELPSELKEIEIKTVPLEEYYRSYAFHPGWQLLKLNVTKEIKLKIDEKMQPHKQEGTAIIAVYRELLTLYEEEFEYNWLRWKKEFNLSDEDWRIVGGHVRDMMERGLSSMEVNDFLSTYVNSKTAEEREKIR